MLAKAKILKMIGERHFVLELVESESGSYYIVEEIKGTRHYSGPILDYKIADHAFYERLLELQGH